MRSLCGFLNGNVGVVKSMLGEMTDDSNRGIAFSYWETSYGLGTIVGPMLGGLLVNPVEQIPWLFRDSEFFKENPYLLPCIVSSVISLIGASIGYFYLDETCPYILKKRGIGERFSSSSTIVNETSPLLTIDEVDVDNNHESSNSETSVKLPLAKVLTKKVRKSILTYATWCLVTIIYEEVYALYVAEPFKSGGLQFTSFDIGLIMSLSGIIQVISQLVIYPIFQKKFGFVGAFYWAAILMSIFSFGLPFCTDFARYLGTSDDGIYESWQKYSVFILLFFLLSGKTLASVMGYIPVIIFVNNSSPTPNSLGTVHGFGQVAASLVR
jgi:hypothetical protein